VRDKNFASRTRLSLLGASVSMVLLLAACGGGDDGGQASGSADGQVSGTLRMFTYDDTIAPAIMNPFKAKYPNLKVENATFNSDAEAAAKIKGGFGADIIEICLDESSPLIDANLLAPIDTSKVTDWDDIAPAFKEADGVTVDGKTWMVPLSAGPHGLIYLNSAFPQPPTSWTALYDPDLAGRVALDGGGSLTPLAVTALGLGIKDPMTMTPDQIDQVKNYMIDHRDQFRTFAESDSDMVNLFKSGEIVLSDGGLGTATKLQEAGVDVSWVPPVEGAMSWVCGFAISKDSENLPASYAIINHYLSPKSQATIASQGFAITNPKALPLIPKDQRAGASPATLKNMIAEVEPTNSQQWNEAWQEIQVGD
jgi:spermidine/putrescine-binding protein